MADIKIPEYDIPTVTIIADDDVIRIVLDNNASKSIKKSDFFTGVAMLTDLVDFVTDTDLTTILNDYVKDSELSTILTDYVKDSELTVILQDYVKDSELSTTLSDYATKQDLTKYYTKVESDAKYLETSSATLTPALSPLIYNLQYENVTNG